MATFHLLNFGCRASQADGAALKRQLLEAGLAEVRGVQPSDFAVLNTCTVTANADAEVRQVIRRIHRANPQCRIVVTGCYAQRAPQEISQLQGVAWVVGNSHKHILHGLLKSELGLSVESSDAAGREFEVLNQSSAKNSGLVQIQDYGVRRRAPVVESALEPALPVLHPRGRMMVGDISEEFHFIPVFPDDRTRPTLKVQDGCNARCAFCVIPYVRGSSRSLAPEKVIEQVRELERAGFQEVVLSGINLGSYGRDLRPRTTFLDLTERILVETSMPRVRISSIEPMDVSLPLIRLVAESSRLAQHFHVPLQSGCDRILRQMRRRYWTSQYAQRILAIREQLPNCGIGADVMVGFPGETNSDHTASARFIQSLPFTYIHVFPYSSRPRTPAAASPDPVSGKVVRERARGMRSIGAEKHQAFLLAQVGRTLSALTLDEGEQGSRVALTSNYLKAVVPGAELAPNTLLDLRIGRVHNHNLYAYPEKSPAQIRLAGRTQDIRWTEGI